MNFETKTIINRADTQIKFQIISKTKNTRMTQWTLFIKRKNSKGIDDHFEVLKKMPKIN